MTCYRKFLYILLYFIIALIFTGFYEVYFSIYWLIVCSCLIVSFKLSISYFLFIISHDISLSCFQIIFLDHMFIHDFYNFTIICHCSSVCFDYIFHFSIKIIHVWHVLMMFGGSHFFFQPFSTMTGNLNLLILAYV